MLSTDMLKKLYEELEKILGDGSYYMVNIMFPGKNKDIWEVKSDYFIVIEVSPYNDYLTDEQVVKIIELGKKLGFKVRLYGHWEECVDLAFMFYKE